MLFRSLSGPETVIGQLAMMIKGIVINRKKWNFFWGGKLFVLLGLIFLFVPANAQAKHTVFLVLSSDAAPYRLAADALTSTLAKQDINTREFLAEDLSKRKIDFSSTVYKTKVWAAIGSRAATYLVNVLTEATPLVYCMVADPDKIGLKNGRENVTGVSVTIPVEEQFAIIEKAIPNLRSIGMLYRSSSTKSMMTLVEVTTHLPSSWILEAVDVDKYDSIADEIGRASCRERVFRAV